MLYYVMLCYVCFKYYFNCIVLPQKRKKKKRRNITNIYIYKAKIKQNKEHQLHLASNPLPTNIPVNVLATVPIKPVYDDQ